jgi:putative membrane protein
MHSPAPTQPAHGRRPFRHNRRLQAMVVWLLLLWCATAYRPLYPRDWLLENLLVFLSAALLVGTYRRLAFSDGAYALFTAFLSLHLVGAHYTYAEVPLGFWVQDALGLTRNHYDRLVHFAFGLLLAAPLREWLQQAAGVRQRWSAALAVVTVAGLSGVYEILEAITAMIVSPELGTAYLGTQGDPWDAQADSALALAGAVIAMLALTTVCGLRRPGAAARR